MNDSFDEILASLPEKHSRSRLEPYGDLIRRLLLRGRTYREIASLLGERFHVRAGISTIHEFVRRRAAASRKTRKYARDNQRSVRDPAREHDGIPVNSRTSQKAPEEVRHRIAALKLRQEPAQMPRRQFEYDPSEPLRVSYRNSKQEGAHLEQSAPRLEQVPIPDRE